MTKVSVIIPNYNHACFLDKRIQSILDQTYQNFEIILMDDSSTDNSLEIINSYALHPKVSNIIINEKNSGSTFKQWNKGILQAKGEYIWIAESDDFAEPEFLQSLVDKLDQNPSVGLAYCQSWNINERDEIIFSWLKNTEDIDPLKWLSPYINNGHHEIRDCLFLRNTIPNASAVVFRKDLFLKVGMANESFKICGDWMMWQRILSLSDVAYISDHLNYFRTSPQSISKNPLKKTIMALEIIIILKEIEKVVSLDPDKIEKVHSRLLQYWVDLWFLKNEDFFFIIREIRNLNAYDKKLSYKLMTKLLKLLPNYFRYKLKLRSRISDLIFVLKSTIKVHVNKVTK